MTPICNTSEQITCHRYKPRLIPRNIQPLSTVVNNDRNIQVDMIIEAVRLNPKNPSHYKLYSSSFNGTFTDSHM